MARRLLWLIALLLVAACTPSAAPAPAPTATLAPPPPTATPIPATPTPAGPPITLYVQPDTENGPIVSAINQATRSVRLKIYLMTDDAIIRALKDAVTRGVDVRVMVEPKPCCDPGNTNQPLFDDLKSGGVNVQWTNPTFRLSHEKTLVIDDALAFIMTSNLVRSAFTSNREYQVLTRVPQDVAEVAAVFDADWERRAPRLSNPRLVWSPDTSRASILKLIDGAQRRLDLQQLSVQDDEVVRHLEAAAKRGVSVRVLAASPFEGSEDFNVPYLQRLEAAGVRVRRLDKPVVHAKVIVADGERALVGSINLTGQSIDFNREAAIILEDSKAIQTLLTAFINDWDAAKVGALFPTPAVAPGILDWRDAGKYYNHNATVEGVIVSTRNTGRVTYLNFSTNYEIDMKVVIFPREAARFPRPPEEMYLNKKIRVTGKIQEYRGAPEIIVREPSQIEIIGE